MRATAYKLAGGLAAVVLSFLVGCATPPEPEPKPDQEQVAPVVSPVEAEFVEERFDVSEFPAPVGIRIDGDAGTPLTILLMDVDGVVQQEFEVPSQPSGDTTVSVQADGLLSGSDYMLSLLLEDKPMDTAVLHIAIELPAPVLLFPPDGYVTIDLEEELFWQEVENAAGYIIETDRQGAMTTSSVDDATSGTIPTDSYGSFNWQVRWLRDDGLVSPPSPLRTLVITDAPDGNLRPASVAAAATAYVSADNYNGAAEGELEISSIDDGVAAPTITGRTVANGRVLFEIDGLVDGGSYRYRLRARSATGGWTVWTDWTTFQVSVIDIAFLPPVETESFTMGRDMGFGDEDPAHQVSIEAPAHLQTTPVTNQILATVLNEMLDAESITLDGTTILLGGTPLVRLGELDYGNQFGFSVADNGTITPVVGKEDHPAIGITWYGAVVIANRISEYFGLPPAYDTETWSWDDTAPSVRLPTEAEWALAARGTTTAAFPWGSDIAANRINYYRSFDPFEDVEFPFTRAGGPTTPVGFYDGSRRNGYATGPNVSPSGHRDVVGNVWEWCWDWYSETEYADRQSPEEALTNPQGPETGEFRVVRGCAWNTRVADLRVTNRGRFTPDSGSFSIGVRVALDVPPLSPITSPSPDTSSR